MADPEAKKALADMKAERVAKRAGGTHGPGRYRVLRGSHMEKQIIDGVEVEVRVSSTDKDNIIDSACDLDAHNAHHQMRKSQIKPRFEWVGKGKYSK